MTMVADDFQIAYCREARRLRCAHASRPARMLQAISELSSRYDSLREGYYRTSVDEAGDTAPAVRRVDSVEASPRARFAHYLASAVTGDLLTYSQRLELLAEADRLGLGRFEANLLIAEAQHRVGTIVENIPPGRRFPIGWIALALGLEALAAVVIYHQFI